MKSYRVVFSDGATIVVAAESGKQAAVLACASGKRAASEVYCVIEVKAQVRA